MRVKEIGTAVSCQCVCTVCVRNIAYSLAFIRYGIMDTVYNSILQIISNVILLLQTLVKN